MMKRVTLAPTAHPRTLVVPLVLLYKARHFHVAARRKPAEPPKALCNLVLAALLVAKLDALAALNVLASKAGYLGVAAWRGCLCHPKRHVDLSLALQLVPKDYTCGRGCMRHTRLLASHALAHMRHVPLPSRRLSSAKEGMRQLPPGAGGNG